MSKLRPAAEYNGAGNLLARYIYGSKINVPEYMVKNRETYRIITDHLGSVRFVVDVATGTVVQSIVYDEYGIVESDNNPGFTPFGFAGGMYDYETGLVRFGARDYDAECGRWTCKDPIGFKSQDINFYCYLWNDPTNWIDPAGYSGDVYQPDNSGKHGGPHVDRYKNGTNVGRYKKDGTPIPHGGKIPSQIPKKDWTKFLKAASKLSCLLLSVMLDPSEAEAPGLQQGTFSEIKFEKIEIENPSNPFAPDATTVIKE